MNNKILVLAALLSLQLALAGVMFLGDTKASHNQASRLLVDLDGNKLNQIKITEGDATLSLIKVNNRWQLADYPELELLESKVGALADVLVATKVSWPVTSTSTSHERFKVTKDDFEKRVVFADKEGNEQTLLLGNSPSFKQLYARNLNADEVYSIEFSAYQLSNAPDDWLDKSMLSIDSISQIKHSEINLTKSDKSWQLAAPSPLSEKQSLDETYIEDFVNQLTNLSVSGIAQSTPQATNTLTVINEQNTQYVFSFASDQENYFVKRNDIDQWFRLTKSKYEDLANLSLDKFTLKEVAQQEEQLEATSE